VDRALPQRVVRRLHSRGRDRAVHRRPGRLARRVLPGIIPAVLLFYIRLKAQEPERWLKKKQQLGPKLSMSNSLRTIFDRDHRRDTIVLSLIMVPVITGLYGGTLFVPTALTTLHDQLGISMKALAPE